MTVLSFRELTLGSKEWQLKARSGDHGNVPGEKAQRFGSHSSLYTIVRVVRVGISFQRRSGLDFVREDLRFEQFYNFLTWE